MRPSPTSAAFLLAFLLLALTASAQPTAAPAEREGVDLLWGGGFLAGIPVGAFDAAVDSGFGTTTHLVVASRGLPFGLRIEASALVYGSHHFTVPESGTGGRVGNTVRTDSWIGNLFAGPELRARSGAVRPYLHALAGVGYFATSSVVSRHDEAVRVNGSTDYQDTTFTWAVGAGVEVALGRSTSLDLGVRYVANGNVNYLAQDSLTGGSGDSLSLTPHRSEAHLVAITMGISFGRWERARKGSCPVLPSWSGRVG